MSQTHQTRCRVYVSGLMSPNLSIPKETGYVVLHVSIRQVSTKSRVTKSLFRVGPEEQGGEVIGNRTTTTDD